MNNSAAQAKVDMSYNPPDLFSCQRCKGDQNYQVCEELRQEEVCKQQFLRLMIETGQMQFLFIQDETR